MVRRMAPSSTTDVYCALASPDAGEGLFGSAAADTEVWLVLEYDAPWAPKPLEAPELLPAPIAEQMASWLADVPKSRHQFIRRPGRPAGAPFSFYVGCSRERAPWMVEIPLTSYEELRDLDLASILRDEAAPGGRRVDRPLHLVCTHGKRDRCCARWGVPLYQALADAVPDAAWQTTHLGGHRFAANVLSLPHGISYGQVTPEEAPALSEAHRAGLFYDLSRLRGRTCYGRPAQAAEYFLRRESGDRALEGLTLVSSEPSGEASWRVTFEAGGAPRTIGVALEETGRLRPSSCGGEPEPAARFRRVE